MTRGLAVVVLALVLMGCGHSATRVPASIPAGRVLFGVAGPLLVANSDGSGRRSLTSGRKTIDFDPTWAPDGRRAAFLRTPRGRPTPGEENSTLWVVGVDGSTPRQLAAGHEVHDPAWSPDGRYIAFTRRGQLMLYELARDRVLPLRVAGACPLWSPDGSRLAFCGPGAGAPEDSTLQMLSFQRGRPPRVKTLLGSGAGQAPGAWSPDGKQLAFNRGPGGQGDVAVIPAGGGRPRTVYRRPGSQSVEAWLPGGRLLIGDSRPHASHTIWGVLDLGTKRFQPVPALRGAGDPVAWLAAGARVRPQAAASVPTVTPTEAAGAKVYGSCRGHGPSVVLESGLGVAADTWDGVVARVARFARVCRYDRPGNGLSPAVRGPHDAEAVVVRLHALVRQLRLRRPLVLVGASFGGLTSQLYAYRYPSDVAGLVLVDSLHPDLDARIERILGPRQARERRVALEANAEHVRWSELVQSDREVRAARRPLRIPLYVLRHGRPFAGGDGFPSAAVERLWRQLQRSLSRLAPSGSLVTAERSGHRIAETQPASVAAGIQDVLARAAAGR